MIDPIMVIIKIKPLLYFFNINKLKNSRKKVNVSGGVQLKVAKQSFYKRVVIVNIHCAFQKSHNDKNVCENVSLF